MQYAEITEQNIESFHLHGDPSTFPITSVFTVPYDLKSGTILQGRYIEKEKLLQIVEPKAVVDDLMTTIFRIRDVLDAVITMVGMATVLALVLVFSLSLKLRESELAVIFRLGCSRAMTVKLLISEIGILVLLSTVLCSLTLLGAFAVDQALVRTLNIN